MSDRERVAYQAWLASPRSIPAAAALLREAGWTVEEPKVIDQRPIRYPVLSADEVAAEMQRRATVCETWRGFDEWDGEKWVSPTCNGTGKRKVGEQ